jgi:glycosyl transferase/beta-hydroxylase protein BlmF
MTHQISVLCPTRGRPELFKRMVSSAYQTGTGDFEVLAYIDDDDDTADEYAVVDGVTRRMGPSNGVGVAWNTLARQANGDVLMLANDDLVFTTPDWDRKIMEAIDYSPWSDSVYVAWAPDGAPNPHARCTFPFVPSLWIDILGELVPEIFHFLYHDTWIHEVGRFMDRLIIVEGVEIEHQHFSNKKAPYDDTYRRHREGKDNQAKRREDKTLFAKTSDMRKDWAARLTRPRNFGAGA